MARKARRRVAWPLLAAGALALLGWLGLRLAPLDPPESRLAPVGTAVLDARGELLRRDARAGVRVPVALDDVAPILVRATLAAEDRRFWLHPGVDPIAIARAALDLDDNGAGASTITQQLARRLYLADFDGPILLRKAREAVLALQLEARWSKRAILAAYLNEVYYGRGAYGVEAAARVLFGVGAKDLDLAQASLLAGLPQLPAAYDPFVDPGPARRRQAYVLDRLVAAGAISRLQAAEAAAAPLALRRDDEPPPAPHFVAFALAELRRARPDLADRPGLVVETTLDASLQREAERGLRRRLEALRERGASSGAVVALDPASGHILAMVGSPDYFDAASGGQINMALQPRQPGSALKPFLYAAALERGFTAATPLLDVPTTFQTEVGPYTPGNYDRRFHGVVPLRVALASSYNVPATRVLAELGLDAFLELAHRVGLRTLTQAEAYGLSLTLGGGEVPLLDLTAAYGTLASGGLLAEPRAVARVRDASGRVLYEAEPPAPRRVLALQHAYLLADVLSDPVARRPGFGAADPLALPFQAGLKTGTTGGPRDNWTLGFTPDRVVGVWVGNADNRPMANVSGIDGAGPVWQEVMETAHRDLSPRWLARPPDLVERAICDPTGLLPGPDCPIVLDELFEAGTLPGETESYYGRAPDGRLVVAPPLEARDWAREAGLPLADAPRPGARPVVEIVQPVAGSVLFLAPELPRQELLLRAAPPPGTTAVEFRVDGKTVGRAAPADPSTVWRLEAGTHLLEVVAHLADGSAVRASATYEVKSR